MLKQELSTGEIYKFFSKSNKFSWIDLTGGEPLLRNDLVEIAGIIKEKCKRLYLLHFPTNGSMPDLLEKRVREMIKLRFKSFIVSISLDGTKEIHDKIRGVSGSFEKSIESFKRLKGLKNRSFNVYLGLTLSRFNVGLLDDVYDELAQHGINKDNLHVNIFHSSGHYYGNKGSGNTIDMNKRIANDLKKVKRGLTGPVSYLERKYIKLARRYLETGQTPLKCRALSVSCFMDPCGNVYPCSIFDKKIGNIRKYNYDLRSVWKSDEAKKIRKLVLQGKCPQCWTPCEAYQTILGNLLRK